MQLMTSIGNFSDSLAVASSDNSIKAFVIIVVLADSDFFISVTHLYIRATDAQD